MDQEAGEPRYTRQEYLVYLKVMDGMSAEEAHARVASESGNLSSPGLDVPMTWAEWHETGRTS